MRLQIYSNLIELPPLTLVLIIQDRHITEVSMLQDPLTLNRSHERYRFKIFINCFHEAFLIDRYSRLLNADPQTNTLLQRHINNK